VNKWVIFSGWGQCCELSVRRQEGHLACPKPVQLIAKLEVWAIAQRDGRRAQYRWRPLFNAAEFG